MKVYSDSCILTEILKVSSDGYLLTFISEFISREALPGQFVEIKCSGNQVLRRPFSIYDVSKDRISFFIKSVGKGTEWLTNLIPGQSAEIIGPLGNTYPIYTGKKALLIGGGCGVASLNLLAKKLVESSCHFDTVFGYGTPEDIPIAIINGFEKLADSSLITVDRGNYPVKGNVVKALEGFSLSDYDIFYCCGPTGMMKALTGKLNMSRTVVSLEARMACGFGVCYGCSIKTKTGQKRVCVDGPVFKMNEVDWNAL